MTLNDTEKDWIEQAYEKEFTELQVRKKLKEARYTDKRIEEFIEYFKSISPPEYEEERDVEDEKKFEGDVKKFIEGNDKDLSWGEKREIKKWIKKVGNYSKSIKIAIIGIRKEFEYITTQPKFAKRIDKELDDLKSEIIERIIDSKQVLEIEDPLTGEEATKESLSKCDIPTLIKLLEDSVDTLDALTNGKITE